MNPSFRDSTYRIYLEFLETAEKKRRWSIFDDIPWDKLDAARSSDSIADSVEIYCSEELYVPDYVAKALEILRTSFGMAWFQTQWAAEETRHGLVFREYLTRSGQRSADEFATLEGDLFSKTWQLPYKTPRRMVCYGALQESVTYVAYKVQKDRARETGDQVLEAIFHFVGRDEAAHSGFYREILELELSQDRAGTVADLAHVLATFKMPGDGLIANYRERLHSSGAGVSPRVFIERVVLPLLATLKIERQELKHAADNRLVQTTRRTASSNNHRGL
ncbi:MAG TPA: acyl-ACP desaturase [Candidatus Binataceae bacterium]|nr:acyl-ACP desaturase [Candidatus Binataceae bacterium]